MAQSYTLVAPLTLANPAHGNTPAAVDADLQPVGGWSQVACLLQKMELARSRCIALHTARRLRRRGKECLGSGIVRVGDNQEGWNEGVIFLE